MNRLSIVSVVTMSALALGTALPAFAHVVVKPNEVGVAAFQTFNLGVPTEKDVPTVAVRLVIPAGLQEVTPNTKPGWTITVKKDDTGDEAAVTEIDWTKGSIPAGQRDDFMFSAQVPSSATTLQWKAYQTYQDGSVVSWDQAPNGSDDAMGNKGPYSETKIVNDLTAQASPATAVPTPKSDQKSFILSIVALAISLLSLSLANHKRPAIG